MVEAVSPSNDAIEQQSGGSFKKDDSGKAEFPGQEEDPDQPNVVPLISHVMSKYSGLSFRQLEQQLDG